MLELPSVIITSGVFRRRHESLRDAAARTGRCLAVL